MELAPIWNIHVCTALPSFHRTPLTQGGVNTVKKVWDAAPADAKALYGEPCAQSCFGVAKEMMEDMAWEPVRVSESLARAISEVRPPPPELTIGGDALLGLNAMRHLPPALCELFVYRWFTWNFMMPAGARAAAKKTA